MIKIQKNIILAPYTSFKIGGPARYFCKVNNKEDLIKLIKKTVKEKFNIGLEEEIQYLGNM